MRVETQFALGANLDAFSRPTPPAASLFALGVDRDERTELRFDSTCSPCITLGELPTGVMSQRFVFTSAVKTVH